MAPSSVASSTGAQYRDPDDDATNRIPTTAIYSSISSLFLSEKFSDMTIHCGGREFRAHCAIVCPQSPFFDKAMAGVFKESTSKSIDLREDDPDVFECFLQFLYKGTYNDGVTSTWGLPSYAGLMSAPELSEALGVTPGVPVMTRPESRASCQNSVGVPVNSRDPNYEPSTPGSESEPEEEYNEFGGPLDGDEVSKGRIGPKPPSKAAQAREYREMLQEFSNHRQDLLLSLRLYVMADKYDVPALRLLSRDRFYRAAETTWETADCFPSVVDELYKTTTSSEIAMREIVCRLVFSRIHLPEVRKKLEPVMRAHGDFATDILNSILGFHNGRDTWL